jgi:hypothetical protein
MVENIYSIGITVKILADEIGTKITEIKRNI